MPTASTSYSEKLKDPRWQKKRLEILSRDNWTCLSCGDKSKTLHVHHLFYVEHCPWMTPNFGLRTLCEDCHESASHVKSSATEGMDQFFWSALVLMDTLRRLGLDGARADELDFAFQLSCLSKQQFKELRLGLPSTPDHPADEEGANG